MHSKSQYARWDCCFYLIHVKDILTDLLFLLSLSVTAVISRSHEGPGEMGKPVNIPKDDQEKMKELFKINQFNLMASDMIALNRSLPDVRLDGCVSFFQMNTVNHTFFSKPLTPAELNMYTDTHTLTHTFSNRPVKHGAHPAPVPPANYGVFWYPSNVSEHCGFFIKKTTFQRIHSAFCFLLSSWFSLFDVCSLYMVG